MITINKRFFVRTLLLLVCTVFMQIPAVFSAGFDYTPAIISVSKHRQSDTVGFNITKEIYPVFYNQIISGSVDLWDSPSKKSKVNPQALVQIEQKNEMKFLESEDLFIYEYWKLYKKEFEFQVLGFSFYARNKNGQNVNFGYIDAADVQEILNRLVIPVNINGSNNLSYWQALMSKSYHFNIVKFGNADLVKNPTMAFDIKSEIFESPKITTNCYKITPSKEIEYHIYAGLDSTSENHWICTSIENFYKENRNVYYNTTTSPAVDFYDIHTPLKVTRIDVRETWIKDNKTGRISYSPQSVRIFINDKPIQEMSMEELHKMHLLVQFKPMDEYLKEKEFKYSVSKINNVAIYGYNASDIKTALFNKDWNKIDYTAPKTIRN